jgi:hypothetical protein
MEFPSLSDYRVRQLKAAAKWSADTKESKAAIKELSTLGEKALPSLQEVLSVTAYDDIRAACTEAIRAIEQTTGKSERKQ